MADMRRILLGNARGPQGDPGPRGEQGPPGEPGADGHGIEVVDHYGTYDELVAAHPAGERPGEAYTVGDNYWSWNGSAWVDHGPFGVGGPEVVAITVEEIDAAFEGVGA